MAMQSAVLLRAAKLVEARPAIRPGIGAAGPMRRGAQEADRASEAAADYTELARVLERRAAFELVD